MAVADKEQLLEVGTALEYVCHPWYCLGLRETNQAMQTPGSYGLEALLS